MNFASAIGSKFALCLAQAAQASQAAPPALAPIRVLAAILLLVLLCGLIYVVRNVRSLKVEMKKDDLIPAQRGPRNNMIFIACAVTFVLVCLLLFLLVKA